MHSAKVVNYFQYPVGFNQRMIMVGQHTPGDNLHAVFFKCLQKPLFKPSHALYVMTNDGLMFITGCGEQVMSLFTLLMREAVPGKVLPGAMIQQFFTLFWIQFAPKIHGSFA